MDNWFEELYLKRKKFVNSARENNFDKGIRQSTVEKYPDAVHFVYELLQNAEDQGATEAHFELFNDKLVFLHNGNPFKRSDVENITGIGNSDKPREANKIGRFGVGFKSVFAITRRPEIYTELEGMPFAFAIEDLVVPETIPWYHEKYAQYKTKFTFPFIAEKEVTLYSKIRERLTTLGFETLLFLQNLASISWQTDIDHGVYLSAIKGFRRELCGESSHDGQLQQSSATFLVFTKTVNVGNFDRNLDIRMAFRLDERGKIIAEPGQNLVVYFPTEQVTGLNFRLHGPFLLTDNRANIKMDNDMNNMLVQECTILLRDCLHQIKKEGLLSVDFLSLLPIRKEPVPPLFRPLYTQVLQLLKHDPLLPIDVGTFANAAQVKLARGTGLRELINEVQLSTLYGTSYPLYWLSSEITQDKTPDLYRYLNKELEVDVVDPEIFARKLEITFLQKQTDEWLVQLYTFLHKQPALNNIIKLRPILRLEDGRHVAPFNRPSSYSRSETPNAFLLREGSSKFPLVKRSLLADDTVYAFLKDIGLSEPDIVDEVRRFILPLYQEGIFALVNDERYQQSISYIQEALQRSSHLARQELISLLNKTPFILAINAKMMERGWKTPHEVYYKTEELVTWFEGNEQAWFIAEPFPETLRSDLYIPAQLQPSKRTTIDTSGHIVIRNVRADHVRGLHGFDPGAKLDGLEHVLRHITLDKARMLWNLLLEYRHLIKGVVEKSKFVTFSTSEKEECFSQMGKLCSQAVWLPEEDGDFYSPADLFLTDLPDGFEKSTPEAYELAIKLGMRKAEELLLADKLGIPHNLISLIQRNPDAVLVWYQEQEQKKVSLPSSMAYDQDRRAVKAAEAAHQAVEKTYKPVSLNRRISVASIDPKTYLRSHHTNAEGQLICQLCNQPMPFKLPDGEEFFVACQYTELLDKELEANHLALCPNCAAEFQYACQTDEDKRAELILELDPTDDEANLVVHIVMPVHQRLRFTQRHLIDLQMAVKEWLEAEPEPPKQEMDMSVT